MIELKHLRTLAALQQSGTLRGAAEQLHLSVSALSHQLAELEARLAAMVAQDKGLRVVVGADRQVPYEKVIVAMDALKRAKVEKVGLVTESGSNAR